VNNRHSIEFLSDVVKRPAVLKAIAMCEGALQKDEDICLSTTNNSQLQVRVGGGKRTWVSMRALLWFFHGGQGEVPTFTKPACGNAGCINPKHQRVADCQRPFVTTMAAE
jgi:hypothetical protein